MGTELLVENKIEDGQRLINQLIRDEIEVSVGFWVRTSEEGVWHLYIASPSINPEKLGEAYRKVYASLNKLSDCWVMPSDLKLINGANPVARAAVAVRDRSPGRSPTRYHGKRLGNLSIEEAYLYPLPGKWFKGFDEIKQNFPSAEVFTIPVLFEDTYPAKLGAYMGTINAEEFEGRRPGTVLFMGPKGRSSRPLAELYFVYRPEGWNTLYRADTNRYEEVRHVGTGEPLYRSADYGPLTALKTQRKPGEDQIEQIRAMMKQGYYITLPPDETPIHTIPFTPPAKADGEPARQLDWEGLRVYLQSGGHINLHSPTTKDKA
jgi:hypothetical protein